MQIIAGAIIILAAVLLVGITFIAVESADAADVLFVVSAVLALIGVFLVILGSRRNRPTRD